MKKVMSIVLSCALLLSGVVCSVSAADDPVETLPSLFTADDLKGMIDNLVFGPSYTITEADGGIKIDAAGGRGMYERLDIRGKWTLDGLRVEMADVVSKSSLMLCLVAEVGGFPTGGAGLAVGLDPTSNKLWITGEGANNLVAETDTAIEPGWSNGTAPAIAGNYSIQFNKTLRNTWIVTINDCAAYEVPAEKFDTLLDANGQTVLSIVSNAAATVEEKDVTFTLTKFVEKAPLIYLPNVRTSFVPKYVIAEGEGELFNQPALNTSVDNGSIFNNVFGGSYELTNLENDGGVGVYVYDDRSEYERLNIGGLWNMDGLRIEFKDVESAAPIMLGLVNVYGSYVTSAEKLSAFAVGGYEKDALRITDGAENVYNDDTTQELKDKELVFPVRKSADIAPYWESKNDYTIQFNKLADGKWMVTVDDCIQYEFEASKLGANVNMDKTALVITTNPKNVEVKFTIASIQTGVSAPVVEGDPNAGEDNDGDNNGGNTGGKDDNAGDKDDNKDDAKIPATGDSFPVLAVVVMTAAALVISKKKSVC